MENIQQTPQVIPTVQPTPSPNPISKHPLIGKPTLILCAILILVTTIAVLFIRSQQKTLDDIYQPASQSALNSLAPTLAPVADARETGALKTYINHDYGYSIEHPVEMEVFSTIENPKGEGFIFFSLPAEQYVTPTLRIKHLKNPEKLSAKAFFDKLNDQEKRDHENKGLPPIQEPNMSKEIEIGGVQTFQFNVSQGDGGAIHTYIAKEDLIVDIEFTDYGENDPKNLEHLALFNKMLSTFRFIGPLPNN